MKKLIKGFFVLLMGTLILTGCQGGSDSSSETSESSSTVESKEATIQATVKIEKDGEETNSKTVEVKEGTSLMEVLEEDFEVETSSDGFVTAIDGTKQDDTEGKYWTFTINGDWGEKGASDTILEDGDEVVFSYGEA